MGAQMMFGRSSPFPAVLTWPVTSPWSDIIICKIGFFKILPSSYIQTFQTNP